MTCTCTNAQHVAEWHISLPPQSLQTWVLWLVAPQLSCLCDDLLWMTKELQQWVKGPSCPFHGLGGGLFRSVVPKLVPGGLLLLHMNVEKAPQLPLTVDQAANGAQGLTMVIGFIIGYQALSFRGQWPVCPLAPSLTFYCHHVVICPFPSLTNEAERPGQHASVDLEEDHCFGPLIMQRRAGTSLCVDNTRRHLLFFALPRNRLLQVCLCSVG